MKQGKARSVLPLKTRPAGPVLVCFAGGLLLLMMACSGQKQSSTERSAAPTLQAGVAVTPSESFRARTGEARGASDVVVRLQFVLVNRPDARRYFQASLGRMEEVLKFVAATHTTAGLKTEAGKARFARDIADNVNAQTGNDIIHTVKLVEIRLLPAPY